MCVVYVCVVFCNILKGYRMIFVYVKNIERENREKCIWRFDSKRKRKTTQQHSKTIFQIFICYSHVFFTNFEESLFSVE